MDKDTIFVTFAEKIVPVFRVSIVMCTYNGERYLARQLDSILQQTYPLHEILIQDDGSTDNTCDIVRRYQQDHPFIRLIRNERNLGFNRNFLSAISQASGNYVALSDQDDIWAPDKIASLLEVLQSSGKAACFSRSRAFSDETGEVDFFDPRTPNYSIERLILANIVPGHTLLMKKSFTERLSLAAFEQIDGWYYDEYIAVTAAACDQLDFCDKYLVSYRRHAAQITADMEKAKPAAHPLRYVAKSIRLYFRKKKAITEGFRKKYDFLCSFPESNEHLDNARQLTLLSSKRGLGSFFRLERLCVRRRRHILATAEMNPLALFFKALFYPFYCANYFEE